MRVLVCGSRTLTDALIVDAVLDGVDDHFPAGVQVVIHGAAAGADTLASEWARIQCTKRLPFPADWEQHGRAAGPIRNQQMLTEGKPDLVLAFVDKPLGVSVGTNDMVSRATKAGVTTYVIQRMKASTW